MDVSDHHKKILGNELFETLYGRVASFTSKGSARFVLPRKRKKTESSEEMKSANHPLVTVLFRRGVAMLVPTSPAPDTSWVRDRRFFPTARKSSQAVCGGDKKVRF